MHERGVSSPQTLWVFFVSKFHIKYAVKASAVFFVIKTLPFSFFYSLFWQKTSTSKKLMHPRDVPPGYIGFWIRRGYPRYSFGRIQKPMPPAPPQWLNYLFRVFKLQVCGVLLPVSRWVWEGSPPDRTLKCTNRRFHGGRVFQVSGFISPRGLSSRQPRLHDWIQPMA